MKIWMRRCMVALLVVGVVAWLPAMSGCSSQKKRDDANRAKPDFNPKAGDDPLSVKLEQPPVSPSGGETPQQ